MKRPGSISPAERRQLARRLLTAYCKNIARYRAQWGLPPDREAHLNAWAEARKESELENNYNSLGTNYQNHCLINVSN